MTSDEQKRIAEAMGWWDVLPHPSNSGCKPGSSVRYALPNPLTDIDFAKQLQDMFLRGWTIKPSSTDLFSDWIAMDDPLDPSVTIEASDFCYVITGATLVELNSKAVKDGE